MPSPPMSRKRTALRSRSVRSAATGQASESRSLRKPYVQDRYIFIHVYIVNVTFLYIYGGTKMAGAVGVFQKEDGYWGYRFSIIVDAAAVPVRGKEYRQGTD